MEFRERETLEFKRTCVDDIRKEIIAMCNCAGGTIYVGVEDDGSVIALDDCEGTTPRIANGVRHAIKPNITGFIHYETLSIDGKKIVSVSAQAGANRPYYMAEKGIRPEGVYVRQGASSVPVSNPVIRQIIKETDGDNYEDMRSLNQALALDEASKAFAAQKLDFGQEMQTLGQLLSEQFPDIIKAATFNGTNQQSFQDRNEFTGSLQEQLSDACEYMPLCSQTHAAFSDLCRQEHKDYPDTALREALLNAITHRDYSFSAGTLICLFQTKWIGAPLLPTEITAYFPKSLPPAQLI